MTYVLAGCAYLLGVLCGLSTAGLIVRREACSEDRIIRRLTEELRRDRTQP